MSVLGFFMTPNGDVLPFGEWVESVDNFNRRQMHSTSFEDEVSKSKAFLDLDLPYDEKTNIMLQAPVFTQYGVVMGFNNTFCVDEGYYFNLFVPYELTQGQNDSFQELYPELCIFDHFMVGLVSYSSVLEFYEERGIQCLSSDNCPKTFSKRMFVKEK